MKKTPLSETPQTKPLSAPSEAALPSSDTVSSRAVHSTVFNPQYNSFHLASKIVVALERISEAFRVMLWQESKANGLSPLQIQILIFLAFHPPSKSNVSHLAKEFNMTKPTISDAVRVLEEKQLIQKQQNETDTRSYSMRLTEKGIEIASKASSFAKHFETPLGTMAPIEQEQLFTYLVGIIDSFQTEGILTKSGLCFSCVYFKKHETLPDTHYCTFLRQALYKADIRIDCPHYHYFEL